MSCIVAIPVASSLSDFDEDKFTGTCRAPRMAARFVNVDQFPPLLLPADFRDWVPAGQIGEQLAKAEHPAPWQPHHPLRNQAPRGQAGQA